MKVKDFNEKRKSLNEAHKKEILSLASAWERNRRNEPVVNKLHLANLIL